MCLMCAIMPITMAAAYFVTTDDVNFRKSASLDGEIIKVLYTSTRVEVLEHDPAGWSKVSADGAMGYIRSDFLTVPKGTDSETFITTDGVNLRTGRSIDSSVITTIYPDVKVEVIEHSPAGWSKVKYDGNTGYIRSDFLAIPLKAGSVTYITTDVVNFRNGPSTGATVISTVKNGVKVEVIEHDPSGWSKVIVDDVTGYIRSDLLTRLSDSPQQGTGSSGGTAAPVAQTAATAPAPKIFKTTDGVNFREGPSMDAGVIRTVVAGTSVEVHDYNADGWSRVKYDGALGYIKSEYLRSSIEYLEWSAAKDVVKIGMVIPVIDVRTGVKYNIKCFSKSGHADVEPLTKADTEAMLATRNGVWSWAARPVWVTINGRTLAAALIGQPHDVSTISDNGMNGHICLHFAGTVTNSKSYQADIRKAVEESWNAR